MTDYSVSLEHTAEDKKAGMTLGALWVFAQEALNHGIDPREPIQSHHRMAHANPETRSRRTEVTFYGKDPEPKTTPRLKTFSFRVDGDEKPREVRAQNVYFYDSGHVGFWNDTNDGEDRALVLAIKALDVWEEPE